MDFVTLIPARRKGVDNFSVETRRLLKDRVFHGFLHFLVTGESLTFKIFFLNHMETYQGCKKDVAVPLMEMFLGARWSCWPHVA